MRDLDLSATDTVTHLSHVIGQATALSFFLGAAAGFIPVLVSQLNRISDRLRILRGLPANYASRSWIIPEIRNLQTGARLLNRAVLSTLGMDITVTLQMLFRFMAVLGSFPNEIYVGILFILARIQLCFLLSCLWGEVLLSSRAQEFQD